MASSSGGMEGYSQAVGLLSDLSGLIGDIQASEDVEEYEKKKSAWENAMQRLESINQGRQERLAQRNAIISQFGSGYQGRPSSLRLNDTSMKYPEYEESGDAESAHLTESLLGSVANMFGSGGDGQSLGDIVETESPSSSTSVSQVDTNYQDPDDTSSMYASAAKKRSGTQSLYGSDGGYLT